MQRRYFQPADEFKPTKPYLTRLVWRDQDGNSQSKLLLGAPEAVLAVVTGAAELAENQDKPDASSNRTATRGRRRRANRRPPVVTPG